MRSNPLITGYVAGKTGLSMKSLGRESGMIDYELGYGAGLIDLNLTFRGQEREGLELLKRKIGLSVKEIEACLAV